MPFLPAVLILEDEPLISVMIQELAAELGCRVVGSACDLDGASRVIANKAIDFAILDIAIDGRSSYALAKRLGRQGTPFLFTADLEADEIHCRFHCPVIAKPFDPSFLQGVIAGQLGLPMPGA